MVDFELARKMWNAFEVQKKGRLLDAQTGFEIPVRFAQSLFVKPGLRGFLKSIFEIALKLPGRDATHSSEKAGLVISLFPERR